MSDAVALIHHLQQRQQNIATAESCTGGLIAAALTDVAGASVVFKGGIVAYDNSIKIQQLDVPAALIAEYGAVSEAVAEAMARGAVNRLQTDYAISTTGVAGPGGGTAGKPVGLVFIACAGAAGIKVERHVFDGTRQDIRQQSVEAALALAIKITRQ